MPVLEITAERLGDPMTLEYVTAVMLWPKDAEQRAEYMRTARARFLTRNVRCASADEFNQLSELALEAMPARKLAPKIETASTRGLQAGEFLATAVLDWAVTGYTKLEGLKATMVQPSRRKAHRALNISRGTLANVRRDFRTVSPLWAATVHLNFDKDYGGFPCPPDGLLYFLSVADFIARAAIAIRLNHRSEPLLIERDLWRVPPGLPLYRFDD